MIMMIIIITITIVIDCIKRSFGDVTDSDYSKEASAGRRNL